MCSVLHVQTYMASSSRFSEVDEKKIPEIIDDYQIKLKILGHWMFLFSFVFLYFIVFSFKQVGREAIVSVSPAVNSDWILKGLETVGSSFVFKYTHLLTVQWTPNFQYCTQLRFVQYWKFLMHCTVSACVYLRTKHSQQSLTRKYIHT